MRNTSLLITILVFTLLSSLSAQQDDLSLPSDNIFGIVEGIWFPDLTCELHPGWERLIFDWAAHQPNGADEWVGFLNIDDRWLQAASDCHREVIAVVKNTPAWATDGIPGAGVPRGLDLPLNDPGNVWASFMRQMGAYYASRGVQRFIIWNEPDIRPGTYGFEFEGTMEDYFKMLKVAYLAVKEGNPAASIHLAGTTYWHDANSGERLFTDRLLEHIQQDPEGAQNNYYFDALSLHIYFRTDTVYDIVKIYRDLLDKYAFTDKEIWITETNASPNRDPNWQITRPQFQITIEQQAAFVVQSAALGLAAGADRIAVYKLYDQHLPLGGESFGILYPADATPRPAFYAWKTVIEYFNGTLDTQIARNERVNIVKLNQTQGRQTLVLWSRLRFTSQLETTATSEKAYLLNEIGEIQIIYPQDGKYNLTLPGAQCEKEEGCVVGGSVLILIQPQGEITVTEVTPSNRYILQFE